MSMRRLASVDEVLREAAKRIGRTAQDVEPYAELLRQHWYDDLQSLASLFPEDLHAIGIPMRVTKELVAGGVLRASTSGGAASAAGATPPQPPRPANVERADSSRGPAPALQDGQREGGKAGKGRGRSRDRERQKGQQGKGKGRQPGDGGKAREEARERTVPIPAEGCDPAFPWRDRVVGAKGRNVKHIHSLTGIKVWFRGAPGSQEDPMCLRLVAGEDAGAGMLDKASRMCDDLVATVCQEAATFVAGAEEDRRALPAEADEQDDRREAEKEDGGQGAEEAGSRVQQRWRPKRPGKGKGKAGGKRPGSGGSSGKGSGAGGAGAGGRSSRARSRGPGGSGSHRGQDGERRSWGKGTSSGHKPKRESDSNEAWGEDERRGGPPRKQQRR